MLEENSQIFSVRIYASSGTLPGRGGPFGAASFFVIPAPIFIGINSSRNPVILMGSGLRLSPE